MNFKKMLEALASYVKSDRAPELREVVQKLVDDERARRHRTAARLRTMRRQLIWYAEHMENAAWHEELKQIDIEDRLAGSARGAGCK